MHFIEWATRGWPSVFFKAHLTTLVYFGAILGGLFAGILFGPITTAYFGAQDRPFVEPSFVIPFSVIAVAFMSFCITNYSLESFTLRRLLRSAFGALAGTVLTIAALGLVIGALYYVDFINFVLYWAADGFYDPNAPPLQRYAYLMVAGLPYGMSFGLCFGIVVASTRVFTEYGNARSKYNLPPA
jgi:hypothetical protein